MNCVVNNDGVVPDDFSGQFGGGAPFTVSGTELDGNQATEEEILPPVLKTELVINQGTDSFDLVSAPAAVDPHSD